VVSRGEGGEEAMPVGAGFEDGDGDEVEDKGDIVVEVEDIGIDMGSCAGCS
jgi:hypothetical protein